MPGPHSNSDITDAISRGTRVNVWQFRSNNWSSHLWRCLPQIQEKCQEFVTKIMAHQPGRYTGRESLNQFRLKLFFSNISGTLFGMYIFLSSELFVFISRAFLQSSQCSFFHTTLQFSEDAMLTVQGTWPSLSQWNNNSGNSIDLLLLPL